MARKSWENLTSPWNSGHSRKNNTNKNDRNTNHQTNKILHKHKH